MHHTTVIWHLHLFRFLYDLILRRSEQLYLSVCPYNIHQPIASLCVVYVITVDGEEVRKGINPKALSMTLKARVIWPCLFVQVPLLQIPCASCTLVMCHSPG